MKYAICYVSTATHLFSESAMEALLKTWEEKNNLLQLKGLLLYSEGNFFQVIEGDKKIVRKLFQKISQDPRHKDVIQVIGKNILRGCSVPYTTDNILGEKKFRPDILEHYMKVVEDMDMATQETIRGILDMFLGTRL